MMCFDDTLVFISRCFNSLMCLSASSFSLIPNICPCKSRKIWTISGAKGLCSSIFSCLGHLRTTSTLCELLCNYEPLIFQTHALHG